ncbi:hypothetical protein Q5P01_005262 [Channa striata]|uniref:RAD51 interacting motif domain-containing protein n=1 Tax=Channa striata TaxID=64152 RepID=A0AA88T755_CHASR|nr:hypothetical protein Q5P01_005262 [Channa striata]
MPGGFDTFEKIQLSLDDDHNYDSDLNNNHFLTSLPGQLLNTPQPQLSHSMPESKRHGHLLEGEEDEKEDVDEDRSLEVCEGDPVVSYIAGSCDGEQEVPHGSHSCPKTSMYTPEKQREPGEPEQRRKTWSPSFMCLSVLEQVSCRPEQPQQKRLKPLRTCTRPIRVGLSKRAKTKHLHRPHPCK